MRRVTRALFAVSLLTASAAIAEDLNPSGHWRGAIQLPGSEIAVEIDLARADDGSLFGTLSVPSERLKGLPFLQVSQSGKDLTLVARNDQPVKGTLSDDGKWIVGEMSIGEYKVPVTLERAGDAQVAPPPASAAIGADVVGTWVATVPEGATPTRLALRLENLGDGTARGRLINRAQGDLEIPVRITQDGSRIALQSDVTPLIFAGVFDGSANAITGSLTVGTQRVDVTFRRAAQER